jgi:hypothetical protein
MLTGVLNCARKPPVALPRAALARRPTAFQDQNTGVSSGCQMIGHAGPHHPAPDDDDFCGFHLTGTNKERRTFIQTTRCDKPATN